MSCNPPRRFHQAKLKVERSKKHFDDLYNAITEFMDQQPYDLSCDYREESGEYIFRAKVSSDIPEIIGLMIGDVIHNLRSALDVLAIELARENGHKSRTAISRTSFPISDSAEGFQDSGLRKIERLSAEAREVIISLKPFKGENDALWQLHQLDILDKHVVLVPVGAALIDQEIGFFVSEASNLTAGYKITRGGAGYPLKDGDLLVSFGDLTPGSIPHVKVGFTVAFGEGRIVDGESVLPTLYRLGEAVEQVLSLLEKETSWENSVS